MKTETFTTTVLHAMPPNQWISDNSLIAKAGPLIPASLACRKVDKLVARRRLGYIADPNKKIQKGRRVIILETLHSLRRHGLVTRDTVHKKARRRIQLKLCKAG